MTLGAGFYGPASEATTDWLGSGFDLSASGIPLTALGAIFDAYASGIPTVSLGAGFEETAEGYPATALGPGWDEVASLLFPIPYRPLTLPEGGAFEQEFNDTVDIARISDIRRETAGYTKLWDDDTIETIQIGGGTANTAIAIGKAGEVVQISDEIEVDDSSVGTTAGPMALETVSTLMLRARGATTDFNEAVHVVFETPFYTSATLSVVAAINEALEKAAPNAAFDLINAVGSPLAIGEVVAINGLGTVGLASATADNDAAKAIGASLEVFANNVAGKIATGGEIPVLFAAGEGTGPHGNKPVFLSATAGRGTLTAPVSTGQVIQLLGYVTDPSSYSDIVGGTMLIQAVQAQRRVLP